MRPNLATGETIIVNKVVYRSRDPKPGEIVVFYVPEKNRHSIKRVIAVAGDKIAVTGDDVMINGKKIAEPYLEKVIAERQAQGEFYNNFDFKEITIPPGHVFVLGDNRSNSLDSRELGPIDLINVIGKME